jgi:FSR family fosmidomycin resistance protein-like MFS transporter
MQQEQSHRNRTLLLVGTLHAFTHLYQVALLPLYLRIQQDLNLSSVEQATLLVTVLGLAYFLPSYLLGAMADRFSRKKLLTIGLAINSIGFILLSLAPNYGLALASAALAGFGGSFYHPAATALVARLFPEAKGRALGLVGIGASLGFFAGPLYTGWRVVNSVSWRTPVLELGIFGLIAAGLFGWLAHEERKPAAVEQDKFDLPSGTFATQLFPTVALWFLFLGTGLFFSMRDFAGNAMATSASLFLQNVHVFSPKATGFALSGIYLASAISNPLFGSLSDRGRMRWVAFVLLLAAGLISIFPRVPVGWILPVLLTYGFFFMASYPIVEAALMESVPDAIRGRVFGLFITVGGLIGNLSHWVVGNWIHKLGPAESRIESYLPLYALFSIFMALSIAGLPLLNAIRKREHLTEVPAGAAALSPLHAPKDP